MDVLCDYTITIIILLFITPCYRAFEMEKRTHSRSKQDHTVFT